MNLLEGRVALITGGARGQGRAHALTCARAGADVVLLDVPDRLRSVGYPLGSEADLRDTAAQIEALDRRVLTVRADVRDRDAVDAAVAQALEDFGRIDILIANAGIWTRAAFWELDDDAWDEMLGVTLTGTWRAAKAVAPHMIAAGRGSIVVTSSINGLEPGRQYAHYTAAKHGLIGLMKAMALELAPHGIRCNAICPGAIHTPMTDHQAVWDLFAGHEGGTKEEMMESGYHNHALKGATFLPPQVIADAALYLNSDLASAVTGAVLPVDAGHLLLPGVNPHPVR
ncbi:mycofactocin-coupled SDR family oxidoreductase [Pseudonocardia xishanensis]|uniref:Rv0687 family mycofactocin-dependent SDR oxidoreductase n=1 Tax=Pseudonocardia xishanensis TaxID=630995 RepID=A0ABP8RTP4_9PSEU